MKKIALIIFFVALVVTSSFAQERAIRKQIENAITYQNMRIGYRNGTKEIDRLYYDVKNCSFKEDDLRKFMRKHPEYKITFGDVEREYKWGYYEETIVSFTVSLNDPAANTLIHAIRLANNNNNLQMPSYRNLGESSDFYTRYVKRFSSLSEIFKNGFFPEFKNYVQNNPDGMKRFCDGSPYSNKELLKDIDVWKLLADSKKGSYPFVYRVDSYKGYIFDSRGRYDGSISNGQAEGQGVLYDNGGKWVGTFKNGQKNGSFTYTQTLGSYGSYRASYNGVFTIVYKGNCVNDQWDGEVVKTVTTSGVDSPYRVIYSSNSDVEKYTYSKGQLVTSTKTSSSLSNYLSSEMKNRQELAYEAERDAQRRREQERAKELSVNVNNINSYVKSISIKEDNRVRTEYKVVFTDGKYGEIAFIKKSGVMIEVDSNSWAWYNDGFIGGYSYAKTSDLPNTREGALVGLYRALHYIH